MAVAAAPLMDEVSRFLSESPVRMFVGGQWVPSKSGKTLATHDPGDGNVLAEVYEGGEADMDAAVKAARKAFQESGWAKMPPNERAVYLHRLADLLEKNLEVLAELESLDTGRPIGSPRTFEVPEAAKTFRWYADLSVHSRYREPIAVSGYEARQVRFPYGVAAFIIPWNFPFLLLAWNLAPALAAGNTVVVKPAEDTPLSTLYFCKLAEQVGIPAGVINVVPGYGETAGRALSNHPGINRMSFTGSPEVGKEVAAACGRNLVATKLELGGKGAAVVFDDFDPAQAATSLVGAITFHAGQVCCTASRWLVHERIFNQFLEAAKEQMQGLKIGHGFDESTQMGPLVSEKQQKRVLGYLERGKSEGAKALLEGGPASVVSHPSGHYVKPALITGEPDNVCAREEIFGPVAFLMKFKNEEEATALVNRSNYGLANSVWSQDLERANRVAESLVAGNSWINCHNVFPMGVPYAGCNLSGLGGGVNCAQTFFDYLRPQSFVRPLE